ncbi:MAG: pitrilysin family protein [Planctomycetota bacterium]
MFKRFSVHQFDNGLTVVLEQMPTAISTAVGFYVKTGARLEDARLDGVSHFLEHLLFKGTATRTWRDINREFDQMGARYNAFTDYEETCYYAWVLNEETSRALELFSDMLQPALPPDEFENEKRVVLEEIARCHDLPERMAFDAAMKLAFAGQRLGSAIIGTRKTVERLTRAQLLAYYQARYVPANIIVFACGNVNESRLLTDIEKLWCERHGPCVKLTPAPAVFCPGKKIICQRNIARQHLVMMWPTLPLEHQRSPAAALLGAILGDDRNSRLYWALKHSGLAEEAGAGYWGFRDAGLITAQAACDPVNAGRVVTILRKEAAKLKKGIRQDELQRVKNRARTALIFAAETPFDRFQQLIQQWSLRRELLTPEEMLARVEEITLDDLYELLAQYPLDATSALVALGPVKRLNS